MYKAKFYKENDYGVDSSTPISDSNNYGLYPFGQLIAEYIIDEFTIKRSMTEASSFNFTIPLNQVNMAFPVANADYLICVIEKDGEMIIDGFVSDWEKNEDGIEVNCEDMLLLISYNRALPFAVFQDMQLISALYKIIYNLDYRRNHGRIRFVLGDFYTMDEPLQVVDLDLREETQAYAQANKALGSINDVYIRSGKIKQLHTGPTAIDKWVRTFDVGKFNYNHHFVYNDANIDSITIKKETEVPVLLIEPYGGEFTDTGVTKILDISYLQYHSSYPTILNPDYAAEIITTAAKFGVRDSARVSDFETRSIPYKRKIGYYNIAPKVAEDPSNGQLGKAAYSLYRQAVKELKNEKVEEIEIQLESTYFPEKIMPGNIITINYEFNKDRYNVLTNQKKTDNISAFTVSGDYYVVDYEITYSLEEDTIKYTLNKSGIFKHINPEKIRRDFNKNITKNPNFNLQYLPADAWAYHEFNLSTGATGTSFDGFVTRRLTVNTNLGDFGELESAYLPTTSHPVNNVFWCDNRQDLLFELSDNTINFGDTFTVDVHPVGRDWTLSDTGTLKILIEYETV